MISEEAKKVIEVLEEGKRRKQQKRSVGDPKLAFIESIYDERRVVNQMGENRPVPDKLSVSREFADGVLGEWLRYTGEERKDGKVIMFVHGGGFNTGSSVSRRHLAAKLVLSTHMDSFSVDYRLCPEYKFPAHLDDCVTAYLWLLKKGYAPENIYFFGESAGANLVLATGLYLKDHYFPAPNSICAFSPSAELGVGMESRITRTNRDPMIGEYLSDEEIEKKWEMFRNNERSAIVLYCTMEESKNPYVSPVYGNYEGFPRLMLNVGTEEILYDDSIAVAEKAEKAGVDVTLRIWEGLFHVFPLFDIPEAIDAIDEITKFYNNN